MTRLLRAQTKPAGALPAGSSWSLLCWLLCLATVGCGDDASPRADTDAASDEDASQAPLDGGDDDPDAAGSDADAAPPDAAEPEDAAEPLDAASEDGGELTDAQVDASPPDAGELPLSLGGLTVTTTPAEHALDLFGVSGHRFWIQVNDQQLQRLNSGGFGGDGDIYVPVVSGSYSDHLLIQNAATGDVADYGKMELALVGESTFRQWDSGHIPNIRIDSDEFQRGARIGGFEHIRLNNSLVGSIFREAIAHRIFHELGYPSLRAGFAFLGSNVWGDGVWVPMTLIEMYKLRFCDDNQELLGGTCTNMWEFPGDLGQGGGGGFPGPFPEPFPFPAPRPGDGGELEDVYLPPNACQIKECDDTRLLDTIAVLEETPLGPGFKEALDPFIEWSFFHRFQCLDWMLWIGDDPLHNSNNNLIVERDDGKLIWAPYSVDISAGQEWYQNTPLLGTNALARGCQSDPPCWTDTVAACEELVARFDALDPENIVDQTVELITQLGMMRSGDDRRAATLRRWYVQRQLDLPEELERFRYIPDVDGQCPEGLEPCNDGGCGTPEQCQERLCSPGTFWCESSQNCYDPRWETCPECIEEEPYYCWQSNTCVASPDECVPFCDFGYAYCPVFGYCVAHGECPDVGGGDEDGGVDFPPMDPGPAIPID